MVNMRITDFHDTISVTSRIMLHKNHFLPNMSELLTAAIHR